MRSTKSKLDSVSLWGLIALCAAMPLLLGGVPDWTVWWAAISLSAIILWCAARSPIKVSPWTAVPAIATLYFLVQLIPLPTSVINFLSPNAAIWLNELHINWAPLSLNAYETLLSTMVQYCFVTALVLGSLVSTRQVRQLAGGIAFSAGIVSLIGWLHIIMDWDLVLGFYQAQDINNPEGFVTSFINSNTCAGFLCLGVATSFGLTFEQGNPRLMRLGLIGAYLSTAGVIMTESKSGLIALAVMCFCWFYALYLNPKFYRIRAYKPYRRTLLWFICPALIMAIIILLLIPDPERFDGWFAAFERKLDILQATNYISDFWAFGSGRGSFETVFPVYQVNQVRGTFSHAENIVFQLLVECGVVVALMIVGWAIYISMQLITKLEFGAHPLHWSLGIAVLLITLQQLADFGLESLGLALPFAVLLGRLMRSEGPPTIRLSPWVVRSWALLPIAAVALHGGIPTNPISNQKLSTFNDCGPVEQTFTRVNEMAEAAPSDYLIFENALYNVIRCHPQEWNKGIEVAKKAQDRAPNRGETRLLTGQLFAHHNYLSQAAVEFKAAIDLSPWLWNEARVPVHAYLRKTPSLLFAAVGERAQHRSAMLGYLIGTQEYPVALSFLDQWLLAGMEPNEYNTRKALICVRTRNIECLKTLSTASGVSHPERVFIINGWLSFLRNEQQQARRFLTKASKKEFSIRLSTSDAIIARELAIELKELELARAFVSIQWAQSDSVEKRTQALYASGMLEQRFGHLREAVIALEKVYQLTPNIRYLLQALKLEIKRRNKVGANLKLKKLQSKAPNHPEFSELEQLVEQLD